MLKKMTIIAERHCGAKEIQGLVGRTQLHDDDIIIKRKKKVGYYPRMGGNSIYRGGDFVGRVMRQGLVGSVQVVLDGLWSEVEEDAPALCRGHGGMGLHPPESVAVLWAIALFGLVGDEAADPMRNGTV
jgi:hypothetical protein